MGNAMSMAYIYSNAMTQRSRPFKGQLFLSLSIRQPWRSSLCTFCQIRINTAGWPFGYVLCEKITYSRCALFKRTQFHVEAVNSDEFSV